MGAARDPRARVRCERREAARDRHLDSSSVFNLIIAGSLGYSSECLKLWAPKAPNAQVHPLLLSRRRLPRANVLIPMHECLLEHTNLQ